MKRAIFFVAITMFGVAAAAWAATGFPDAALQETTARKQVKTVAVSPTPIHETVELSGFVRSVRQTSVTTKTSGYVVSLGKEEGEAVQKGDILAVLDGNELSAAKESALLSFRASERALSRTKSYYDQKVDEAKTALENAAAGSDRDAAEEALKSAKKLRDAQIASAKAEKAAAEGAVLLSESSLENTVLRAPFSGVITQKSASLGAFVSPGTPVYMLAAQDELEVVVSIPRSAGLPMAQGDAVSVHVSGDTDAMVSGYVFSVARAVGESTQQTTARIRFRSGGMPAPFHLGDHVVAVFSKASGKSGMSIPEDAILRVYDDTFVFVVENGIARKQPVVLGVNVGENREIISGFSEGMRVVTEGQHMLRDEEPVNEVL